MLIYWNTTIIRSINQGAVAHGAQVDHSVHEYPGWHAHVVPSALGVPIELRMVEQVKMHFFWAKFHKVLGLHLHSLTLDRTPAAFWTVQFSRQSLTKGTQ